MPVPRIISMSYLEEVLGVKKAVLLDIANNISKYYEPFDMRVPGKRKWRHIDNPTEDLKCIQKKIYSRILKPRELPLGFTGGVSKREIRDNVAPHVGKEIVVCLDVKNYFPSISNNKIFKVFKEDFNFSTEVSCLLTKLTTFHRHLPQGAPTSPCLANLSLMNSYTLISKLCLEKNLALTIYVDDITLSGVGADRLINAIIQVVQKDNLAVSNGKIKVMRSGGAQVVTGVKVNKKINVSNDYFYQLRKEIFEKANSGKITKEDLQRILSKIKYVKGMSESKGFQLENLYNRFFPRIILNIKKNKNLAEIRKCDYRHCMTAKRV